MKTYTYPFVFFVCLGFLFNNNTCKAQQVLNGSFEDNTFPHNKLNGNLTFYLKRYSKNVEVSLSFVSPLCINCNFEGSIFKDTLPEGWIDNPNINSSGHIIRPAPHGKT